MIDNNKTASRSTIDGWYLNAGQAQEEVPTFGIGVIAHSNAVLASNALPADWILISLFDQSFETIAGPNTSVTGSSSVTTVLAPSGATLVPLPSAIYLFGGALVAIRLRRSNFDITH